ALERLSYLASVDDQRKQAYRADSYPTERGTRRAVTQSEHIQSVNARDDLEREVFPGVYVGKFPADAVSAKTRMDQHAPVVRRKGAKRVLGLSHRFVAIFIVGGLVAALAAIMLAKLGSDAGDSPPGPQLLESPRVLGVRLGIAPLIVAAPSS